MNVNHESAQEVLCPSCKGHIGYLVQNNEVDYLLIGGGIAREWHGVCAQCGGELHWSTRDRLLAKEISQKSPRHH